MREAMHRMTLTLVFEDQQSDAFDEKTRAIYADLQVL